jgi:TRAP-type C4-dicarboxylate transport system substrate-binding protein
MHYRSKLGRKEEKKMRLLKGKWMLAVLVVSLIVSPVAFGVADEPKQEMTLKWSYGGAPSGYTAEGMKWAIEEITRRTGGKIKGAVYFGTLFDERDVFSSIGKRVADVAFAVGYFTVPKNPYFSTVELQGPVTDPWVLGRAESEMLMNDPRVRAEFDGFNTVCFATHCCGTQIIVTKKVINSVSDLKGARVRAPGACWVNLSKGIGMVPVAMPPIEVYDALGKGVIDAAITEVLAVPMLKWEEVSKTFLLPGIGNMAPIAWVMNKDLWNSLPKSTRDVFLQVGNELSEWESREQIKREGAFLKQCEAKGIRILRSTAEEKSEFEAAARAVREAWFKEWDSKGLETKAFYEDLMKLVAKYQQEVAKKGYPWGK